MVTTVDDLVTGEPLEVIGGQAVPLEGQIVDEVRWFGAGWQPLHERPEHRKFMAVVPAREAPADIDAALSALAAQGAVAVSLTGDGTSLDVDKVRRAADAYEVIVLAAPGTLSTEQLIDTLMHRQNEAHRRRREIDRELFRLYAQLHQRRESPRRLLEYVERQTGVRLDIIARGDALWQELATGQPDLDRLAEGAIAVKSDHTTTAPTATDAASTGTESEWHISLHALQGDSPRPVLYARTPGLLSPSTLDLIEHTTLIASLLLSEPPRGEETAASAVDRAQILRHLQMGDVSTASRLAETLAPGVLTSQTGRVAIVECGIQENRVAVSHVCENALSPVLVAPCPAYERHLVLALPDEADDETVQRALRPLAEGRAVGVSSARPWSRTGRSYQSAFHALSAARARGTRVALESGEPLAVLLPQQARVWGRAMTARLGDVTGASRSETLGAAQLVLAHGDAKAGSFLRIPRTTAGTRLDEVMGAMGLSRGSLVHRATADLALQLAALPLGEATEERVPVGLVPFLTGTGEAASWAERYLARLDERQLEVLTVWLAADGQRTAAARRLGTSRNTVGRWLDQAGAQLSRALRDPGEGPHDPLWALLLTGRLPLDVLPPAAFSPADV